MNNEDQTTTSAEDDEQTKTEHPAPATRPDAAARDAAKYRRRAHEAEAQRDQLAQQADQTASALYDTTVRSLTAKGMRLTHPDDLARFTGKDPASYMTDGQLDTQALQSDLDGLAKDRPELFISVNYTPRPDLSQGRGGGTGTSGDRWTDAFRRRR